MSKWTERVMLGALLLVLGAVQGRFTWVTLEYVFDPGSRPRPPVDLDIGDLKLTQVRDNASKAGAKSGDVLVGVNGRAVQSHMGEAAAAFDDRT